MAIKFFNIKSKEVRVAETEPLIAALLASSDRSPNITQGQDMGWRLAPEVVIELKQISRDQAKLQEIAVRYGKSSEDIRESDILQYISDKTDPQDAPVADIDDYEEYYNQSIRKLEAEQKAREAEASAPVKKPVAEAAKNDVGSKE